MRFGIAHFIKILIFRVRGSDLHMKITQASAEVSLRVQMPNIALVSIGDVSAAAHPILSIGN